MKDRLIGMIMPPKNGASDEQLYFWRMTIAIAVMALSFGTIGHMAWSIGAGPFSGEGFVQQAQFEQMAKDVKKARLNTLRTTIIQTRKDACAAKSGPYKTMLALQLTELLTEWQDLTGKSFPVPSCSDIL